MCSEHKFTSSSAESLAAPTQIVDHTHHLATTHWRHVARRWTIFGAMADRSRMTAGGTEIFKGSIYIGWETCSANLKSLPVIRAPDSPSTSSHVSGDGPTRLGTPAAMA